MKVAATTKERPCVSCGSSPAVMARLQMVKGLLIAASQEEVDGPFCRDCGVASFRRAQNRTLLLGWWSPLGILMNLIAITNNLRARRKFARLGPPMPGGTVASAAGPMPPGRSVWKSPGAWVTIGVVTAITVVIGGAVAASARRGDDGEIVRGGALSAFQLVEGDCFDLPDGEAPQVHAVPCSEPHDAEVVAIADYPAAASSAFPGEADRYEFVGQFCLPAFGHYVGTAYEESELDVSWLEPTPEGWTAGDRTFTCAAVAWDGTKLTDSVRGSER